MPPRGSKRKSADPLKSAPSKDVNSAPAAPKRSKVSAADKLFNCYANQSLGMIDPEGIEALCSDLKLDHTDVRILMLAWKLKAQKQGYFSQDEWQKGLKPLKVDTINKLKKALPELEKEALKAENFEDFFRFAFRYNLTEEKQKCIDIDTACILLDMVLGSQFRNQIDLYTEFLKIQTEYKVINMDQWINFYRFCKEINFPDLEGYDNCHAWPLILDNFVEWFKEKRRGKQP